MLSYWDKFKLREFENTDIANRRADEMRNKLIKNKFEAERRPLKLIIIGISSIIAWIVVPDLLNNPSVNNIIKLLLSGALIFASLGVIALPYGIYKLIKKN